MPDLPRRLAAEALGTALLAATVIGAGLMAAGLTGDRALMLLANALPAAAMIVALGLALSPVSGAHLNPAITLMATVHGGLRVTDAAAYVGAQLAGALAGAVLAHLMFGAGPLPQAEIARGGAGLWLGEMVATFGLVLLVAGANRASALLAPVAAGLFILAAYWFTASTSFANPALTLARAFTGGFTGIRLADVPGFVGAQLAGALIAIALGRWLFAAAVAERGTAE
jgi:glycerol uptake facilitator-like aquaporin